MERIGQTRGSRHDTRSEPVQIEPAAGERRSAALSLLLTGKSGSSDSDVQQFLNFAGQENVSLAHLWHAQRRGTSIASSLVVPCPGRTAMIFVSPLQSPVDVGMTSDLIRAACRALDPHDLRLIQALLDPYQKLEVEAFTCAGFAQLAHLLYMTRKPSRAARPLDLGDDIQVTHWSEKQRSLFADTILASYDQTMDCPGLLGLRDIDDIIQGHMATGRFEPKLWYALNCGKDPAGVMLLNPIPQHDAIELVYLGVAVKYRGRGLSRRLLEHALGVALERSASSLILAVDEHNDPAIRLYRAMRFISNARKLAMILALP